MNEPATTPSAPSAAPSSISAPPAQPLPETTARLIFIRHGKQIPTSERTDANRNDPPLAETGRHQAFERAQVLCASLKGVAPVLVTSSPMLRALQTAAPIAEALGATLAVHGGCYEFGAAGAEFRGSGLAVLRSFSATLSHVGPRGEWDYSGASSRETDAEIRQRARHIVEWLRSEYVPSARGGVAILVAHATFLDLLVQLLVSGTDARWQYGDQRYKFGHAGAKELVARGDIFEAV
tara:strand:- start:63 stop:773 length:711 start_codon:yes stop_codon:yes gene_type:complete